MKKRLILPILLILFMSQPAIAQDAPLNVGSEIGNHGFRQVYYIGSSGEKQFITDGMFASADPQIEGDYIAYMSQIRGLWQIFLYHIPTNTKVQLTTSGNNVNPEIEDGYVVWEGWVASEDSGQENDAWQIFLYDGTGVKQLTAGDITVHPDIEDGYIIMARRDSNRGWRSVLYSINDETFAEVSISASAKHPKLVGKKIFHSNKEFPLITDDIYLLGFDELPSDEPPPATQESVIEEVYGPDATSSAEMSAPDILIDTSELQVGTDEADLLEPPDGQ